MSPRNDLNSESFGKRVKKLEAQSANHTRQLNEAAAEQTKGTAADIRAKSVQRRTELETAIDAHVQYMPPATPPNWMLDHAAAARLQNFQALNRQPQTDVPKAMTASWEQQLTKSNHNRRIGERMGKQQQAEQQWQHQHDASINRMRHERAMTPQSQARSKGRHDDGVLF